MRIDPDVLDVIRSAAIEGPALYLPGQLDARLYQRVNLVLSAVGGRWNRGERAHLFPVDAADAVAGLLNTGEVTTDDERGWYPTPAPVVDRLLELADLTPGCEVLEPSAGCGAIAEPAAARGAVVDCVELDPSRADHIRAGSYARSVTTADFLMVPVNRRYQRVIMNPPFADRQDIRHVERALRFLKPGGLLVAVMFGSLTFRQDRTTRDFLDRVREARGMVTELPDDAFPTLRIRTVVTVIPVREAPAAPRFNRHAPRPEDFNVRPRIAQQALFFTDEETSHGTASLDGYGGGEPARGHQDQNSI
ncbi:class I SAM-dependent methyltransferase [Streptomyces sp. NPDC056463]|uniref:class I SAM-dependent methyltransferase n=1 Tax=Streptomyces sp. NPDC056463 TaxID=3345827 RepID=UPI00369DAB76